MTKYEGKGTKQAHTTKSSASLDDAHRQLTVLWQQRGDQSSERQHAGATGNVGDGLEGFILQRQRTSVIVSVTCRLSRWCWLKITAGTQLHQVEQQSHKRCWLKGAHKINWDYQRMGTLPSCLLHLVGKPQLSKKLQTGLQELKVTKIKASIQSTHLCNIWVQQNTKVHPLCLYWIYPCVHTEATCDTYVHVGCTRSLYVLRTSWYQHRYGHGKWPVACVDRTGQGELELICHVTAPLNRHCKVILHTEESVPWLEAWWIFRAKEHVV